MGKMALRIWFLTALIAHAWARNVPEFEHLLFKSCGLPGWTCVNQTDDGLSSTISTVTYQCQVTVQDGRQRSRYNEYGSYVNYYERVEIGRKNYTLDLSDWTKLPITSIIVKNCDTISLKMHTVEPTKVHTLIIEDMKKVTMFSPVGDAINHPHSLAFRKIQFIPVLPTGFISQNNTKEVEFSETEIGLIQRDGIFIKTQLKSFEWNNIKTIAFIEDGITVQMEDNGVFHINGSTFPRLRPQSFYVKGGSSLIENSQFKMIQKAAFRLIVDRFNFTGNDILNHDLIYVVSPDITFKRNNFTNFNPTDLISWTTHTGSEAPRQISFTFIENSIESQKSGRSFMDRMDIFTKDLLHTCTSIVSYEKRDSTKNCSTSLADTDLEIYQTRNIRDISVLNLLVCDNAVLDGQPITLPTSWYPKKKWSISPCSHDKLPGSADNVTTE